MSNAPPFPTVPPPGYLPYESYQRSPPPGYYAPRYAAQARTASPQIPPKGQGHFRRASHAVPPQYSYATTRVRTPHLTLDYVPIYDQEPKISRPRRASHSIRPQPSQETPQRTPDYVPIYDQEPESSRPRRASHTSRPQPLPASKRPSKRSLKRPSTAKNNDKDVSSEVTSDDEWENFDRRISLVQRPSVSPADLHVPHAKPQRSYTSPSHDHRHPRVSRSVRERDLDQAMLAWFPPSLTTPIAARKPFSEADLRGISDILCRIGRESWSRVPRIYTILRTIDQLSEIDCFLKQELSDMSFPFNKTTLPTSLKCQAARSNFLEAQKLVLTKALDLERENGKHLHFSKSDDIPFQRIAELGKGGFSYVDRVLSTISFKEYARKLIPRGRTFRKDQEVLKDFEKELTILKRLSHKHVVELVGSYTDPRYVGIIMSPVADCNLKQFLSRDPLPPESRSFLPTFFGCLTSALRYLHENFIRHRDVKPQNVLVKAHQVFLTDFGISRDWSELGHSTTTGPATKTLRYCAPEVAAERPRNSSSDIWSLGCVFLEIWSVLCGETLPSLAAHMESSGSHSSYYYQNTEAILSWCKFIRSKSGDEGLERPYVWITSMLKETPDERWIVQCLFDRIQETNTDPDILLKFSDHCCIDEDDVFEDARSSDFEHDHTDTTKIPDIRFRRQGRLIGQGTDWQKCYNCKAVIEIKGYCNHMACRCRAQFCMACAAPWKTCGCPWFNYPHADSQDDLSDISHKAMPDARPWWGPQGGEMVIAVNAKDSWGQALLLLAVERGHAGVAELLLEMGADVNAQVGMYDNALQTAPAAGRKRIVTLLLSMGADVNAQGWK